MEQERKFFEEVCVEQIKKNYKIDWNYEETFTKPTYFFYQKEKDLHTPFQSLTEVF